MLCADGPQFWRFLNRQSFRVITGYRVTSIGVRSLRGYSRHHRGRRMRWCLLVFRSMYTVDLLILDQPSQFDLPQLEASKPCNQLDAQQRGASDETREEGTSGLGTVLGSALRAVAPQALTATPSDKSGAHVGIQRVQVMGTSDTSKQTPKGSGMGPKSPLRCTALRRNLQR